PRTRVDAALPNASMSAPCLARLLIAAVLLYAPSGHAQSTTAKAVPFQIMETTIDDVHAAYKTGKLTAHQLVQGYLDRINAYDKQGPRLNSVITLNAMA